MANTVTIQTIHSGPRHVVLNVYIAGDGSGNESGTIIADASAFGVSGFSINAIYSALTGFTATLFWDADADAPALHLPDYQFSYPAESAERIGGIPSSAGAGATGDLIITTVGLGSGDVGNFIVELKKRS